MNCLRTLFVAGIATAVLVPSGGTAVADDAKQGECILNAFATKLGLNEDQKTQLRRIHDDFEKRAEPTCRQIMKLHVDHHHAVLQILSPEQKQQLPDVMKAERDRMLDAVAKKFELTEEQKKQAAKLCDETAAKFKTLAEGDDPKRPEAFKAFKNERFEAFCAILTDDQRVKLPALIQEEMQNGRTPGSKSDLRNAMVEKLKLDAEQQQRLDKTCDEFAGKIDEQKATIRKMCKEKNETVAKVLTEEQKVKFEQYVKAAGD
jgi:Spy/CpxP family protein refolding chaperone